MPPAERVATPAPTASSPGRPAAGDAAREPGLRVTFLTWRDSGHPDGGGSEVWVEQIARRLADRGHRVTIRTARYPGAPLREHRHGVLHSRRGGRLGVYAAGLAFALGARGRRQDVLVDVINGLPFGTPLARRRGLVAVVHHVHRAQWSIIYPDWRGRLGWFVESRVAPRLYRGVRHVTVSESTRRDLAALGVRADDIDLVPNGLPPVGPRPPAEDVPLSREPRLCVLARLVPHKQIEHALHVVAALSDEMPGLALDVIGSGWWHDRLVAHAEELGVRERVTFHGHVSDVDRDLLLAAAWVHLLPSVKEGWGIAVLEAGRAGTPTIGYRSSGGLTESVHDGRTGVLVDSLHELVAGTRRLLADDDARARMAAEARTWAARFDWDRSTDAFEAVLRQVAPDAGSGARRPVSGRRR